MIIVSLNSMNEGFAPGIGPVPSRGNEPLTCVSARARSRVRSAHGRRRADLPPPHLILPARAWPRVLIGLSFGVVGIVIAASGMRFWVFGALVSAPAVLGRDT